MLERLLALISGGSSASRAAPAMPRASSTIDGGLVINTPAGLEAALREGNVSLSGAMVTADSAMRIGAVFGCVRIITSGVAVLPIDIKQRVDERTRRDRDDHPLSAVLRRRPNGWQTRSQFRRQMQANLLLRGNAYALIVRSPVTGAVQSLIPLHPDRVRVSQQEDLSLIYDYTRRDGVRVRLTQQEVFHLVGLSLDGVSGVSVISYARETMGLAATMERHGAEIFSNGALVSGVLSHPKRLGPENVQTLRESLEDFRAHGARGGGALVLEEGMTYERIGLSSVDAQWIEEQKFTRSNIAMFFGVPPHMLGDTEKSTSWGSGIEQQRLGYLADVLEDHLTTWEDAINTQLLGAGDLDIYARFNRSAAVRGDIKTRWESYIRGLQWGVLSPNDVLAMEDRNPREGGDIYYPPPNTAGSATGKDMSNEPA